MNQQHEPKTVSEMQQHFLCFAALKFHQLSTLAFSLTPPSASHPLLHADLAINSELRAQEDGWATCSSHHTLASTIWGPKEDTTLRCLHTSSPPPLACLSLLLLSLLHKVQKYQSPRGVRLSSYLQECRIFFTSRCAQLWPLQRDSCRRNTKKYSTRQEL